MSKELFFSRSTAKTNKAWLEKWALMLNNLMVMPMKILEYKCNIKGANGNYRNSIIVEDCLDEKEWEKLVEARRLGFNSALDKSHYDS